MGNFLLKNLDKNTNSIVDICFDDVVVLDVDCGYCGYQILRKVYRIFEKPKFKKKLRSKYKFGNFRRWNIL